MEKWKSAQLIQRIENKHVSPKNEFWYTLKGSGVILIGALPVPGAKNTGGDSLRNSAIWLTFDTI